MSYYPAHPTFTLTKSNHPSYALKVSSIWQARYTCVLLPALKCLQCPSIDKSRGVASACSCGLRCVPNPLAGAPNGGPQIATEEPRAEATHGAQLLGPGRRHSISAQVYNTLVQAGFVIQTLRCSRQIQPPVHDPG